MADAQHLKVTNMIDHVVSEVADNIVCPMRNIVFAAVRHRQDKLQPTITTMPKSAKPKQNHPMKGITHIPHEPHHHLFRYLHHLEGRRGGGDIDHYNCHRHRRHRPPKPPWPTQPPRRRQPKRPPSSDHKFHTDS
jgi:hypothetical protein